ncbi:MAG: DUF2946 family protein [Planctomycetota bacterium]
MRPSARSARGRPGPSLALALFALLFQLLAPLLHELQHELDRHEQGPALCSCGHAGLVAPDVAALADHGDRSHPDRVAKAWDGGPCPLCEQLRLGPREVPCPDPVVHRDLAPAFELRSRPRTRPPLLQRCEPWSPRGPPAA